MNIANILDLEKEAIRFEGISYTYKDLAEITQKLAGQLQQRGIKAKDRVALYLPNCPEFIFWYLAIAHIGAIVVPLHFTLTLEEVQTILTDCSASLLITNREKREGSILAIPSICVEESPPTLFPSLLYPIEKEDELAILYTSGTTGFPKGATLTHGNVRFISQSIIRLCQTTPNDRLLLVVPLSHCFGQNLILHHALQSGASIVLVRSFDPKNLIDVMEQEKVTMIFGVPTMYRLLLQASFDKGRLNSIRYCHSGAASLSKEIAQSWFMRFGIPIHQGYGLTESSPLACYNTHPQNDPTSIGKPIEQVKVKIVDDQGVEVAVGELGEIAIQGPNVMKGYWNRAEDTALTIRDNWLYSGDIGRVDALGNFYLIDRKKDLINVSGMKVYPAEVERILEQHPAVKEAAVFGLPDPIIGERIYASIVLKEKQVSTHTELIQFCKKKLAPFKIPEKFDWKESLPRNPTGKILRRMLREKRDDNP